jgi:hypothetical protein
MSSRKFRLRLNILVVDDQAAKITRLAGPNKMGIRLDRLPDEQSARLQNFLLPLILKSLGE